MAVFNFSIIKKPTNNVKKEKEINIFEENITGYVGIKLNGEFYILYNNVEYQINQDNFNCKNHKIIYPIIIDKGSRVSIIRNENLQNLSKHYLPFAPGSVVTGNIFIKNGVKIFDIKKIHHNEYDNISKKLFNYWKLNYKEIKKSLYSNVRN